MPRLIWGTVGERYYEAGVDRGVLFIDSVGVPWNGLKSVAEAPSGGEPRPFYLDGIKYLNVAEAEEYIATINAFSAPTEFDLCDGNKMAYAGLLLTNQPKKSFGFTYRTQIGNDVDGTDFGYKIHIVYNALAVAADKNRVSLSNNIAPTDLSWAVTTTPPAISGFRPTAHIIIDSRTTPEVKLALIEDILYGSTISISRLPTPAELLEIFSGDYVSFLEIAVGLLDGIFDLHSFGYHDLEGDPEEGIYTLPEDSRLVETEEDGIYILET